MKELTKATEPIKQLTVGAMKLDQVLDLGKVADDKASVKYIDYLGSKTSKTVFVKSTSHHNEESSQTKYQVSPFVHVCHFCSIRTKCFEL